MFAAITPARELMPVERDIVVGGGKCYVLALNFSSLPYDQQNSLTTRGAIFSKYSDLYAGSGAIFPRHLGHHEVVLDLFANLTCAVLSQ